MPPVFFRSLRAHSDCSWGIRPRNGGNGRRRWRLAECAAHAGRSAVATEASAGGEAGHFNACYPRSARVSWAGCSRNLPQAPSPWGYGTLCICRGQARTKLSRCKSLKLRQALRAREDLRRASEAQGGDVSLQRMGPRGQSAANRAERARGASAYRAGRLETQGYAGTLERRSNALEGVRISISGGEGFAGLPH